MCCNMLRRKKKSEMSWEWVIEGHKMDKDGVSDQEGLSGEGGSFKEAPLQHLWPTGDSCFHTVPSLPWEA